MTELTLWQEVLLVAGMTAVTFFVRYPSLALVGRMSLPLPVMRALRYVPVAVLTAITVPYVLYRPDATGETVLFFSYRNAYLVAGIFAVVLSWRSKNLLVTIAVGLIAFFLYRWMIG